MTRLSILVPSLGSADELEATLLSVLENRPASCRIIVALGADYADPYRLEGEVLFVHDAGPNWVRCVNAGLAHCRGKIVHILTSGAIVEPGWAAEAIAHFVSPRVGMVSPLVVGHGPAAGLRVAGVENGFGGRRHMRTAAPRRICGFGPSSIAGFYRRAMLVELGGFDTQVGDEFADLDLVLRARRAGYDSVFEPTARILVAAPRPLSGRSYSSGKHAEHFYRRHLPRRRAIWEMSAHAAVVAGEIAACLLRPTSALHLAGRLAAWWSAPADAVAPVIANETLRADRQPASALGKPAQPAARRVA